jgi:hypothetical protein
MVYDAKGNTHSIFNDPETLNWTKNVLQSTDLSESEMLLNLIWDRYNNSTTLNQNIVNYNTTINPEVLIVISGRTSKWINSQSFADVASPYNFTSLPGYEKFFSSDSFQLLFSVDKQIYVFEWSKH